MSEKGKNLATHEDIDKVVDQVRAVTQTTKEIETKITDQVWDRQRRWELRRDQIMKMLDQATEAKHQLVHLDASYRNLRKFGESAETLKQSHEAYSRFNSASDELEKFSMTASLFCTTEAVLAISAYLLSLRTIAGEIYNGSQIDFDTTHHHLVQEFFEVITSLGTELA